MKRYNPIDIEPKWQAEWEAQGVYRADDSSPKPKKYVLDFFPYPSGAAMHVGHVRNYTISDALARFERMRGHNVLRPMGWDAFGLPAENYAIKTGTSPKITVGESTKHFKKQLTQMGIGIDWSREFSSADPSYYKWTQWFFKLLFERGLAYQKVSPQWWCETDKTVLANEQVEAGRCWRCGNEVTKKPLKQWFFKITNYADRLAADLQDLDWSDSIKSMQRNWIGRSQGAEVNFAIAKTNYVLLHGFDGSPQKCFFPWLAEELQKVGDTVHSLVLPNTQQPNADEQAEFALKNVEYNERTVLLGHSYGAVTALKIVEQLDRPIAKLVLVSGFAEPGFMDHERNFEATTNWHFDFAKIRKNVGEVVILRPTNDAAVPPERADFLQSKLGGTIIDFEAERNHACGETEPVVLAHALRSLTVFTTRPDTLFGATFLVLAPEHPLVDALATPNFAESIAAYKRQAQAKTDVDRMETDREKSGVFTGSYAINPVNGQKIPVWVADYVLMGYGTGAIMAVPAHDERDFAFAQKFKLPIVAVIEPETGTPQENPEHRRSIVAIVRNPQTGKYLSINWGKQGGNLFVGGGREDNEDIVETAMREITEETGYKNLRHISQTGKIHHNYFAHSKNVARRIEAHALLFELVDDECEQPQLEANEQGKFTVEWLSQNEVESKVLDELHALSYGLLIRGQCYSGEGVMLNSGQYDGLASSAVRERLVADLTKKGVAQEKTTYRIRDWLISRQRYWGAPIPIIHCPKDGAVAVPESQLPVELPDISDYQPAEDGRSPLARLEEWVNVECPTCGGPAKRETDTMDGFACSSWYFMRFADPHNTAAPFDAAKVKQWLPVDTYVGGAEHAVMHLLYARFWTKVMFDAGLVDFAEPFTSLKNHGMILAPDGRKMSKSLGNVIAPDELISEGYGADSIRLMELFIGPWNQPANWSTEGLGGCFRFLQRAWTVSQEFIESKAGEASPDHERKLRRLTHKTIKKVTDDLHTMGFNTAIAALMEFVNELYKLKVQYPPQSASPAWQEATRSLAQLLAPFAPHLSEELWYELGNKTSVHTSSWPTWDDSLLLADSLKIVVQVNGKVRATIEVLPDVPKHDIEAVALASPRIAELLAGKTPKKIVYVPGRLLNIVA